MADAVVAITGVVVGAALSYARDFFSWLTRRRSYEFGVAFELRKARTHIDEKMKWLSRPVPQEIAAKVPSLMVSVDGRELYLGEEESFRISLPFWEGHYSDIIALMNTRRFRQFAYAFDLVQSFEVKFAQLKMSFRGSVGDPKLMATAVYRDLYEIKSKLDHCEASRFIDQVLAMPR